jgi:hypothetical protein
MRTVFGAVAGALAMAAVLVAYDLGEQRTFSRDAAMYGEYPRQMRFVSERIPVQEPVVRRASAERSVTLDRATPRRTWQKSALLIGGSAGAGAGLGALMGGKKGALAGAAIGGGAAAIYDQVKRH